MPMIKKILTIVVNLAAWIVLMFVFNGDAGRRDIVLLMAIGFLLASVTLLLLVFHKLPRGASWGYLTTMATIPSLGVPVLGALITFTLFLQFPDDFWRGYSHAVVTYALAWPWVLALNVPLFKWISRS